MGDRKYQVYASAIILVCLATIGLAVSWWAAIMALVYLLIFMAIVVVVATIFAWAQGEL